MKSSGTKAIAGGVLERWFTAPFRASHPKETQIIYEMLLAVDPEGYIGCCGAVRDADLRKQLSKVQVPCMVVAGTQDGSVPLDDTRYLANHIRGAQLVELAAAHLSNVEASAEFNRHVLQFFLS